MGLVVGISYIGYVMFVCRFGHEYIRCGLVKVIKGWKERPTSDTPHR